MPLQYFPELLSRLSRNFHKFLEVYFDDWTIFGLLQKHIENLRMMFDRCKQYHISPNFKKCILCFAFGILLGHVVCKHGLIMDPANIAIIVNLPLPTSVRQLRTVERNIGSYMVL